jgi:hypothetical protein
MKNRVGLWMLVLIFFFVQCSKNDISNAVSLNNRNVGASARELLTAEKYQTVNLQILYMPGFAPDATAINNLVNFLNALVNKPGGIQVSYKAIAASGKATLTLDEIIAIEKLHRTVYTSGSALGICLLYTDGDYNPDYILGLAYMNTSMVIFGKTVHDNSGALNQPSLIKLETTVTEHEFGHILGLVNVGSPMQMNHKDSSSNHCNNNACLMYVTTNISQVGNLNLSGPVLLLDANCKNDLKANGGK